MLEKMGEFFDKRLDGYDEHMMTNIESADEFYPFTARCLPLFDSARVLDLGCGTGLELEEYFKLNPTAAVTGIDLARGMLSELGMKEYAYEELLAEKPDFALVLSDNGSREELCCMLLERGIHVMDEMPMAPTF